MGHMVDTQAPSINKDHLHAIIKHFREAFPDNFDKCGMKVCKKCDGSGIPVERLEDSEITYWSPGNYCTKCNGYGVTGIYRIYEEYVCKKCNGNGCDKCNNRGTIDWISNATKG